MSDRKIKGGITLPQTTGTTYGPGDESALAEVIGPSQVKHLKAKGAIEGDWSKASGNDPQQRTIPARTEQIKPGAGATASTSAKEAEEPAGGKYDDMTVADLKKAAEKQKLEVKRADGKSGDPLKADYIRALQDADGGNGGDAGPSTTPAGTDQPPTPGASAAGEPVTEGGEGTAPQGDGDGEGGDDASDDEDGDEQD